MRKPVARAIRSKFSQRNRQDALRRAATSAAPAGVSPFEALEDRRLFSVLANYYNDGFWGNGNAGRPAEPNGAGGGVYAFPNQTVSVARAGDVQKTVDNVDYAWGTGSPDPAIRSDNFSTLFVGKIVAPTTGTYEILGYGDDDTHVFVNGQLVSSDPGGHGETDPRSTAAVARGGGATTIDLTAGQSYDLVVAHAEGGGGAGVHLRWVLPGGDSANPVAVPAANLLAEETAVTAPTGLTRDTSETNGVKINFTDTSTSELRYDLQRRTAGGTFTTVASGPINASSITDFSAQFGTAYEYRVVAWNLQGQAVSTQTVTATLAKPAAVPGAQGYYFNDDWWKAGAPSNTLGTGVIVGYSPDATSNVGDVSENWGDGTAGTPGSPAPAVIRGDDFSTVFTGKIHADETGQYQILGFSDDDSYVWVNGQLVSADPNGHGVPTLTTDIDVRNPINLTAGQDYDFVMVQHEGGGGAAAILRWVTPSMTADGNTTPVDVPEANFVSNQASNPGAPTGLAATATDVGVVKLTWNDASTSEVRYTLERSTGSDFSNATKVLLPINTNSYQDTGLTRGTQYFYRITAENFTGSGAATANVTTPAASSVPATPTNLVAYNVGNRNLVQFTDNSINETGFIVERRLASGGTYAPVAGSPIAGTGPNVSGGTISFFDTDNVVSGQSYVYRVRAVNADNLQSANSNEATTSVHGLRATIYDSQGVFGTENFYGTPTVSPTVTRIDPNIDYDFGNGSPDPKVDGDLFAIDWDGYFTAPTTGSYTFYGESDDGIRVFVDGNLTVNQWVDRGDVETPSDTTFDLTAGQKVELRVQYYENGGGALARLKYSTDGGTTKQVVPVTALTPADASNPLRAPTNVNAVNYIGDNITLTWLDNSASETGYRVERSTTGDPADFTAIATLPADQSGYIDSGLDVNTTYYYRVVALGAGGATQASDMTSGTAPYETVSPAVNYANFSDPNVQSQWQLNPRGTTAGAMSFVDTNNDGTTDTLQLTDAQNDQSGTSYLVTPFDVTKGFTSSFTFVSGGAGAQSGNPADGFTWILQAAGLGGGVAARTAPVGGGGGGLGYTGIGNSVAVKFDLYPNLNQTGLYVNGNGISDDPADARNRTLPANFDINGGTPLKVTIAYNADTRTLTETVDDVGNAATAPYTTSYTVDIPAVLGSGSAFVGFGAATGGENARQQVTSFAFDPTAPAATGATIAQVFVKGSTWAQSYLDYLGANGLGDSSAGFRVDNLAASTTLPWINANQIVLRYSGPVSGAGIPTTGSVTLDGQLSDYTVTAVSQLDPQTVVLTLDRALGTQPITATNTDPSQGDRVKLTVPGAGLGGGSYVLELDPLQGDVDRAATHRVNAIDLGFVKARSGRSTTDTGTTGATYTAFADVNGSGRIDAIDLGAVKARNNDSLPVAAAAASSLASSSVTKDLFGEQPIL